MKTTKLLTIMAIALFISATTFGQEQTVSKTETLMVSGNCGMCKKRIENTAKKEGATKAEWNSKSQTLSVTYETSKTSLDRISLKLNSVGHDTEKGKADDKVYNDLPACCQYR